MRLGSTPPPMGGCESVERIPREEEFVGSSVAVQGDDDAVTAFEVFEEVHVGLDLGAAGLGGVEEFEEGLRGERGGGAEVGFVADVVEVVRGAACTTLPPVSWCWPSPAYAIDRMDPCAPSPTR